LEELTVTLDHLLLWLSAKGQGSWSQFRGAVEALCAEQNDVVLEADDEGERPAKASSDLPIYQQARFSLQRLGHVEFFSNLGNQDWRVVPSALALRPSQPSEGFLCGARSPDLLDRLHRASNVEVVKSSAPGMPERIIVRGSSAAIARAAVRLGLLVQVDAPAAILSAVPGVRDPATWFRMAIPETPGWTVHRFSRSRLGWAESTGIAALNARTGLFRFVMDHQRFYYLKWHGRSYRVPVQVGKYAVMRKSRGLMAYDAARQTLSFPAVCRPPLLIERALVLCSGFLPSFDSASGRVEYTSVPPDVAHLAGQLLLQEIAR
jgi:hypothetical protein